MLYFSDREMALSNCEESFRFSLRSIYVDSHIIGVQSLIRECFAPETKQKSWYVMPLGILMLTLLTLTVVKADPTAFCK